MIKETKITLPGTYVPEVAGHEITISSRDTDNLTTLYRLSKGKFFVNLTMNFIGAIPNQPTVDILAEEIENAAKRLLIKSGDIPGNLEVI